MSLKRLISILMVIVFFISVPSISSQTKNRVAVAEADRVKLYEFNSTNKEFDLVWESADISLNRQMGSPMRDMHIVDIDNDGKFELIAIDQYGIFIWRENGKYPQYFAFQNSLTRSGGNYILAVDIVGDSRKELLTQQRNRERDLRLIIVWKNESNRFVPFSEIELPGDASWSLRHGDFDGDGKIEILTSANLIHILGWKDDEGLVIEAEFPNLAGVIDNVRPADIDGDGIDEIIASGNSGVFSVYKHRKIHERDYYPLNFQSMIEPGKRITPSQGLHFGDIDGDDIKEVLVGLSTTRREKDDTISIYKQFPNTDKSIISGFQFEKEFSMLHESSSIPGFVIGDADNDGQNEVIYNNKYVLKFSRDADGNLSSESMGELSKRANSVAIGPFYPSGEDKPNGLRIIPTAINIDLKGEEYIESEKTYQIRVKLKSSWQDVKQVRVRLESDMDVAEIEPKSVSYDTISAGQEIDNSKQPFILNVKYVEKLTPFELRLVIETGNGFRMEHEISSFQTGGDTTVRPKLTNSSETLAMRSEEKIFEGLGIDLEYFNYDHGMVWPSSADLNSYKNLIFYDEASFFWNSDHVTKLKSFLDKGGNCLLQGYEMIPTIEDLGFDFMKNSANFINSYLHVGYLDETDQLTGFKGQKGDVITDGINFDLNTNQNSYLPAILEPRAGAFPILFYPDGKVAGVRIDGPYKMVILAFNLNDIESVEVRKTLLQRIMDWFDQE